MYIFAAVIAKYREEAGNAGNLLIAFRQLLRQHGGITACCCSSHVASHFLWKYYFHTATNDNRARQSRSLKLSAHYPCPRPCSREHGCPKWRPFSRAVFTARETWVSKMTPMFTGS